ncbi:uncharacterized protein LOC130549475 isoform X1 [Triplophysa rosa]|uniref:uncharacterized protein LOC130549475 isoform X1 n=1 Tax=Triplophysa rosa TaxID=992332 RepID=UPI002545E638|nr:uncharacterized protein LOC130549475 isoform X1 [Triplophysa rosa]
MMSFCKSIVVLLVCAVFGAVTDDEQSVSVNEGESVTLHTDVTTKLQNNDKIRWMYGEEGSVTLIAQMSGSSIKYEDFHDDRFKDRLQIFDRHTGDLIIKNIKHKHSGRYKVGFESNTGTTYKRFRVNVSDAPHVISAGTDEVKSVSVSEGDSVTLHTDVQTHRDDLILWRFGDEGLLIAKDDKEDNKSSIYNDADGMFRDRLKIDDQTGSLIITNIKTTDTGVYKLKISSNRDTKLKTFIVSVTVRERGLSSGQVAGIIVGVLLAIAVVIAVGVFSYRRINYELQKRKVKVMTVIESGSVTLECDVTKLQSDDVIQWIFRDEVIATFNKNNKISSVEERLTDRLKVDDQTGSLIIKDIKTEDAGLYKVKISSSSRVKSFLQLITGGGPSYSQFNVIVKVSKVENSSVTLDTGVTELQTDDVVQWRFGDEETLIAEIKRKNKIATDDERFRDRLKLNLFGSLTITDLRTEHTGHYKQKIISSSRGTSYTQIEVIVEDEMTTVELEGSVTLKTVVTEIQFNDKIHWTFGYEETLIAQIIGGTEPSLCDFEDERFRDRLKLNPQTGDLTIRDTTAGCTGLYQAQIHSRRRETEYKGYKVAIFVFTYRGESVTLNTESKIQRDGEIKWIYDKTTPLITGKNEIKYTNDERFKDRLKMNPHTGDLTITDTRWTDGGLYTLQQINSDGKISYRIFQLFVREERIRSVELGRSVTLETDVTEIQTKIVWTLTSENLPIAQMTVGTEPSYNSNDERYRNRLKMNPETGDLTITYITSELTGVYAVQIHSRSRETECGIYVVARMVFADKGESVTLHTESEIQRDSDIKWMLDDIYRLVAGKNRDSFLMKYTDVERFRDRLKMNPETGDLMIRHIRQTDAGVYRFQQVDSDGNISCRIFWVCIRYGGSPDQIRQNSDEILDSYADDLKELNKQRSGTEENESTTVLMPLLTEAEDEV